MKRDWVLSLSIALLGFAFIWQGITPKESNAAHHKSNPSSRPTLKKHHKKANKATQTKKATPSKPNNCAAIQALDKMDNRIPVPLQPMMAWHQKQNMQSHLQVIQKITGALANKNWKGIIQVSKAIESSPQMKQMCSHMGAGAKGFTQVALDFHKRANEIAKAAKKHNATAVLQAVSHTLKACTNCHATYKQEILNAKDWQLRTGMMHNPTHHSHGR